MKLRRKTILNIAQAVITVCLIIFIIVMVNSTSSAYVPMSQIEEQMREGAGVSELRGRDDSSVSSTFGFIPAEYLYFRSDDIMDVRELFIARAADDEEMERITEACETRLSTQIDNFTGYGTNQLGMLEQAIVMQKGDYYFYAVSDEADEWQQLFLKQF